MQGVDMEEIARAVMENRTELDLCKRLRDVLTPGCVCNGWEELIQINCFAFGFFVCILKK